MARRVDFRDEDGVQDWDFVGWQNFSNGSLILDLFLVRVRVWREVEMCIFRLREVV